MMMSKKTEVLQAAVRLFAEKGFAATGIRELGSAAGLNSATLYHYAGGKNELLSSIMRECLEALLAAGRDAVGESSDPVDQLARLVAAHVGFSAENPLTGRVTDQEMRALDADSYSELVALRDDYESMFSTVINRGIHTGAFEVFDPHLLRLALLEMLNGVAHWYRPNGRLSCREVQRRFVEYAGRLVGIEHTAWSQFDPEPPVALGIEPPRAVPEVTSQARRRITA
ncbi:TetR/AcrR family transcriptional regulator [Brevibacterium aurantiacum]|uniref:TetR/AcrR family transcriptional regulator n=1 Tax=Brevibacterium aurantiacum TaxID=273384 RepID=UPI00186612DE|nr:TetR/AcrR family transcriptional regulator [Brevibacterium aurantiacum]